MNLGALWDAVQEQAGHAERVEVTAAAAGLESVQESLQHDFRNLTERMDRLMLVCRAMHEMLVEVGAYTDDALKAKILELDMLDGRKDGKVTPSPKQCPKCEAMICRKFNRCLFLRPRRPRRQSVSSRGVTRAPPFTALWLRGLQASCGVRPAVRFAA